MAAGAMAATAMATVRAVATRAWKCCKEKPAKLGGQASLALVGNKKLPKADNVEGTVGRPQLLCRPRVDVRYSADTKGEIRAGPDQIAQAVPPCP